MKPRSYAAGLAALGGTGMTLWQLWATVPTVILVATAVGVGVLMALIMSVAFPLVQRAFKHTAPPVAPATVPDRGTVSGNSMRKARRGRKRGARAVPPRL